MNPQEPMLQSINREKKVAHPDGGRGETHRTEFRQSRPSPHVRERSSVAAEYRYGRK